MQAHRSAWLPCLILVLTLGLSWQLWQHERDTAQRQLKTHFDYTLQETVSRIEQRMVAYEQLLRGVQAQYAAMDRIDRQALRNYVATLQLDANFSGVQAIGQIDWVLAADKAEHLARMRRMGFADYRIEPEGEREAYGPIVQREPYIGRNRAALGFDAWAEPIRHLAMERARDSGMAAITGKVRLVTETEPAAQAAFLMYLPIYAHSPESNTLAQRRAQLLGWTYASFRMNDLMASLYGQLPPGIRFSLHDGIEVSGQSLLYRSGETDDIAPGIFTTNEYLVIAGRTWTLTMTASEDFSKHFGKDDTAVIAFSGIALSLLLTLLAWLLSTSRSRALHLAQAMTHELQESTRFVQTVADNIPGLVAYWNADLRCQFANAQHQAYFGKTQAEIQGMTLRELLGENAYRREEPYIQGVLRGEVQRFEGVISKPDGSTVYTYACYLPDAQGDQVQGFYVLVSDITTLKEAEAALVKSEEYARTAIDAMPEHICVINRQGEIISVNQAWRDFYASNAPDSVSKNFGLSQNYLELCRTACGPETEQATAMAQGIAAVMNGEYPCFELEYACDSPNETRIFKAKVTRFYGDSGNLLICHENITERSRVERRLRHFAAIIESSEAAIISKSLDGTVSSWNPGAQVLFGYPAEEMIGQSIRKLFPDDRQDEEAEILARIQRDERIEHFETLRLRRDGSTVEISATVSPIFGSDGEIVGISTIARDISAQKLVEAELANYRNHLETLVQERTAALSIAKEAAEAANRAKSIFLATMSHELRTPMNAIMGLTEIIRRKASDAKQIAQLEKIQISSNQLLEIINDILELSNIEADQLRLEQRAFTLAEPLAHIASRFEPEAQRKELAFIQEIDPDLRARPLLGDPVRLEQILIKLISNAIKFTAAGSIKLRAAISEDNPGNVLLRFEIIDTGIGIPPAEQGRLFSVFEQIDGSLTRKYQGTGLGLAISKRLVQALGGNIGVESQFAAGSCFWFTVRFTQ